jgi:hypothetical protein
MTLLEDIEKWYEGASYPPTCKDVDAEKISFKYLDSLRWGTLVEIVYKRGDEYVMVSDVEPATEMQSWGDYGEPEISPAVPIEVTVTEYVKA